MEAKESRYDVVSRWHSIVYVVEGKPFFPPGLSAPAASPQESRLRPPFCDARRYASQVARQKGKDVVVFAVDERRAHSNVERRKRSVCVVAAKLYHAGIDAIKVRWELEERV